MKLFFIIISFFLISCSPQSKKVSNDSYSIKSSDGEYIVAEGLYKINLPWMWFDMTSMDITETLDFAAERGHFDINSELYKAFRSMTQRDQESGSGANIFIPLNVLLASYASDTNMFGIPNLSIAYSNDIYQPFSDEYIVSICDQKEQFFKSLFSNPNFEMAVCGRSNVLKGKNQMFTKFVNHPEKDFEQYVYSTYLHEYMVHSAVYTCHKEICDLYFPQITEILKSFNKFP